MALPMSIFIDVYDGKSGYITIEKVSRYTHVNIHKYCTL